MGDLAEIELETIRERIEAGVDKVEANGAFVGKPGFGFEVVGEKYDKTLATGPALEPVLRDMIRLALSGKGFAEIARWLNEAGVLPPQAGKARKGCWDGVWSVVRCERGTDPALDGSEGSTHRVADGPTSSTRC